MSLRLGVQRLLVATNKTPARNLIQRRWDSVVGGPPANPLSDLEALVFGGGMCAAILYLPIYSLFHMREYSGKTEESE